MAILSFGSKKTEEKAKEPDPVAIPPTVKDRLDRGGERMRKGVSGRNLCWRFFRGDQFYYVDDKNVLQVLPTVTNVNGGGKKPHRVRESQNLIKPIVEGKVSGATKRVPSYEVNPTSPEKDGAAELSEKIAVYGYDQWRLRRATKKIVTTAIVADGGGFAWPYWDQTIGPFSLDPVTGKYVGVGDIRVRTYTRNQVTWEPGVDFEDSPWIGIEQAVPLDELYDMDGYLGGTLIPDAQTGDTPRSDQSADLSNLALRRDYLERPCPKYPQGRWLTIANKRVISGIAQAQNGEGQITRPYPLTDQEGNPLDEPVLHRLSYTVDPDSDEDMSLVAALIGPQRIFNNAWSKANEWMARCLNPQMLAPVGSLKTRPDDTPGAVKYYVPVGGLKPEWEQPMPVPDSVFRMMEEARSGLAQIAGTDDVPSQIEAAKAIEAFIENQQERWQTFIADLAEWHSRIMRHCLFLVQKHYTEPRLVEIRGRFGTETIPEFKGRDLLGQTNVRVFPSSIEPLTRDAIQNRIMFFVQNFPGQVSLEEAMAAVKGGTAEALIESFEQDVGRANRLIQKLKAGPDVVFNMPPRPDGTPGWMPRKQDNLSVHLHIFGDYMKTDEFDMLDPPVQEAFNLYYDGCEFLQQQKAMEAAAQQQAQAQGLGMQNASKPQGPPPTPNQPQPQAA